MMGKRASGGQNPFWKTSSRCSVQIRLRRSLRGFWNPKNFLTAFYNVYALAVGRKDFDIHRGSLPTGILREPSLIQDLQQKPRQIFSAGAIF